jgi:hypothetical protein
MSDTNDSMAKLYAALARAQGKFQPITKNRDVMITMKSGGKYKFRYADLDEINRCTRKALSDEGLSIVQPVNTDPATGATSIDTMLLHADGGALKSSMSIKPPAAHADPKDVGATLTYFRRYAITALLGLAADDDLDANGQGAGGQGGNASTDEAARIGALVDTMIAEAKATTTDKAACDYWRANNAKLVAWPNAHDEFKAAFQQHRRALAQKAQGVAA